MSIQRGGEMPKPVGWFPGPWGIGSAELQLRLGSGSEACDTI